MKDELEKNSSKSHVKNENLTVDEGSGVADFKSYSKDKTGDNKFKAEK